MKIVIASSNKGKIKEIQSFFKDYEIIPYTDLTEKTEIEENGDTFKENAIIKAKAIHQKLPGHIILADDSGISVPAFNNEPGIYSARYAGENATDTENLNKLINKLKQNGIKKTSAYYTAAVALATPYGTFTAHGFMRGSVIDEKKGKNGFGYDPIFIPDGFTQTLGELDEKTKQQFSHRTKALKLASLILRILNKGK